MIFEEEYKQILNKFCNSLDGKYKKHSFSILGSPLVEAKFLMLGNNWGGENEIPSQKSMPLVCDILAYPNEGTYLGYINFFTKIFDGDKYNMIKFLNQIVYTNACFLRTKNETNKYHEDLKYGYKASLPFLEEIISIVKPHVIVCFGNGNNPTCSSSISEILGYGDEYWTNENVERLNLGKKANSYLIDSIGNNLSVTVYSFPHASRFNSWGKLLDNNYIYSKLKREILSHKHTGT